MRGRRPGSPAAMKGICSSRKFDWTAFNRRTLVRTEPLVRCSQSWPGELDAGAYISLKQRGRRTCCRGLAIKKICVVEGASAFQRASSVYRGFTGNHIPTPFHSLVCSSAGKQIREGSQSKIIKRSQETID